ncbi:flagellar protein FlaG [Paraglaciecola aquimarina]|uniref:Flagellar protein FlaG n=1 Tax=Paraglaciecola algarum TaxID=3050085 RepID=A0ABS9D819_9ALTE|nr:flagellar protein FlaG [Paraglaciecola sp. G1-23]MCF2948142.1 flagellar protein FlaG [Paraglaciecola sp. G1-23]
MKIDSQSIGQDFASVGIEKELVQQQTNKSVAEIDKVEQLSKGNSSSAEKEERELGKVSPEQIDNAVSEISEFVQASNRQLNFSIDEDSKKQIVKVTDTESGEVIRQIPSEEILQLSDRLRDLHTDVGAAVGLLFNKQV